jgi:hypothetical protein
VGRILAAEFAGPVASVTLALEGAEPNPTIAFKTAAPGLLPVGARVSIDVVGKAHVFAG